MVHLLFVFLLFIHLHKGLRIIFYFNEISIQRKRTKKWPNDRDGLITYDHEKRKDSSVTSGQSFSKWANRGLSLFIFVLFNTVDSKRSVYKFCRWLDSNHGHLGVGSNRSTNWATTTAHFIIKRFFQPNFVVVVVLRLHEAGGSV